MDRHAGLHVQTLHKASRYRLLGPRGGFCAKHDHFARDVVAGLSGRPKRIAPRYFYDDVGSILFQRIMDLPEYYLSRCEHEILENHATEILGFVQGRPLDLVDLGAGDGRKTLHLLSALHRMAARFRYVPVDASEGAMIQLMETLDAAIPGIHVEGLVGDYMDGLTWLGNRRREGVTLVLFLGSNIGNFTPTDARAFATRVASTLRPGDHVLMGFDLCKSLDVLQRAYDDRDGITAAFNLNLLQRMNRELGADFHCDDFCHHPIYNPLTRAMESYLVSLKDQSVHFDRAGCTIDFHAWEAIHTESSCKYTPVDADFLAAQAGFVPVAQFHDDRFYFLDTLWCFDGARA